MTNKYTINNSYITIAMDKNNFLLNKALYHKIVAVNIMHYKPTMLILNLPTNHFVFYIYNIFNMRI